MAQNIANKEAVGIQNASGARKNPATEEKQDAAIANQTDGTQKTQLVDALGVNFDADNPLSTVDVAQRLINVTHTFTGPENWVAASDLSDGTDVTLVIDARSSSGNASIFLDDVFDQNVAAGALFADTVTANETVTIKALNTGGDIDGATYSSKSKNINAQIATPFGLHFSSDGTKMLASGQQTGIHQYALSTAWDVSTATATTSGTAEGFFASSIFANPTGTKVYTVSTVTRLVYEYDLSVAWDLSTAVYNSVNLNVATQETTPNEMFIKPDGLTLYIYGLGNTVFEYTMSVAWDLSTASFTKSSLVTSLTTPTGMAFQSDGTRFFAVDQSTDIVTQYDMDTAWDLGTATLKTTYSATEPSLSNAMYINDATRQFYLVGFGNDTVYEYSYTAGVFVGDITAQSIYTIGDNTQDANIFDVSGTQINPSTKENQTSGDQKTQLVDSAGNNFDTDNPLFIHGAGEISTVNSTSTPLTAGSVFTGTAEDIRDESVIIVTSYSDVASATDGLMVQWSTDGTNWDGSDTFTIPAAKQKTFTFQPVAQYFRIVYTNGGTNQTEFRLQVSLKSSYVKPSSHRIQDPIIEEDDAELVKSVITGKDPNDVFRNINSTVDGDLSISNNSSGLAIAKGDVTGYSSIQKFANAPDFDESDGEVTIWDGAEDGTAWELMSYVYSTTADIDSISSSDAGDTQEITVIGLDTNYNKVTQSVTLNGQTRVALSTSLIRVYRAYNNSSVDLTGHVIVYVNTALTAGVPTDKTKIRAIIDPVNQQTEMAVYTVPAGKTGYLVRGYASTAGASKSSEYIIKFLAREFGKVFRLQNINSISDTGNSIIVLDYFVPLKIEEKTDLEVRVSATAVGATKASISSGFDIILVDN